MGIDMRDIEDELMVLAITIGLFPGGTSKASCAMVDEYLDMSIYRQFCKERTAGYLRGIIDGMFGSKTSLELM